MRKICSSILFILTGLINLPLMSQADYYLLIGTYTTTPTDGIEVFSFDSHTGGFQFVQKTAANNPSYLAITPDKKHLYAVAESGQPKGGKVSAYTFDATNGHLEFINSQTTLGNNPCYVSVHKSGRWVAAANYSSGNMVYYATNADGSLQPGQSYQHEGSSVVKGRQDGPHAHSAVFTPDFKYLMVQDLGLDKIMIYPLDASGKITSASPASSKLNPGSGPRHLEFHPNGKWAYLMEELSGNLTALSYKNGKFNTINSLNAYPADYKGPYGSADVHVSPDGRYVYGSNRAESNTIAIFKIDQTSGKISMTGTQSTMGRTPRNFNFDPTGNYLLVANQDSHEVVVFKVNKETGMLTDTGTRLTVNKPVCLKWVKKQ